MSPRAGARNWGAGGGGSEWFGGGGGGGCGCGRRARVYDLNTIFLFLNVALGDIRAKPGSISEAGTGERREGGCGKAIGAMYEAI